MKEEEPNAGRHGKAGWLTHVPGSDIYNIDRIVR